MSSASRVPVLAPFQVRSFRFQWPADLATSWAFEMEALILGWFILVETGSVLMLTYYASLLYIGTLLAPMFGVVGDRTGHRTLLAAMRALYAACALTLMSFAYLDAVTPALVLCVAAIMGLVRPSDIGVRAALVGETMPSDRLMGAMSIQRTTLDSARIAGALTGAGLVAAVGMGPAYTVVASLYAISVILTLKAGGVRVEPQAAAARPDVPVRASPWRDLKEGLSYVWNTPLLLAAMWLAFLVNLTAFPLVNSLLPYVAKDVYFTDQTGLGYLVASFATGALLGSIVLSRWGGLIRPARMMLIFCATWYALIVVYAQMQTLPAGMLAIVFTGFAQSLSMISMAAMLLRNSAEQYHGRVMGIRMLAIYGNVPGLLISAPLIAHFGFPVTAMGYAAIGLTFTLLIAVRWRTQLWRVDAPANTR